MPFVQGKCESCGGILTVDPSLKAANCPFCGAAYVVQDSISYYRTTINVDKMHADVINISDESSSEGRLKAGDAWMKIGNYKMAQKEYEKAIELTPQNYLGWLGLLKAYTENFTQHLALEIQFSVVDECEKSILLFAPDGLGEELLKQYRPYIRKEKERFELESKESVITFKQFEQAVELVLGYGFATVSMISSQLGIDMLKAAKIVTDLEKHKIITRGENARYPVIINHRQWQRMKVYLESTYEPH